MAEEGNTELQQSLLQRQRSDTIVDLLWLPWLRSEDKGKVAVVVLCFCIVSGAVCLGAVPTTRSNLLVIFMWLVAQTVEAYILLWPELAKKLGNDSMDWYLRTPKFWPEGYIYKNLEVWKAREGGTWPSITDNLTVFYKTVVGPRLVTVLVFVGPLGMAYMMMMSMEQWRTDLDEIYGVDSALKDLIGHTQPVRPITDIVLNPTSLCRQLGFTPLPYTYLVMKVLVVGFLQDLIFGTKNLFVTKMEHFSWVSLAFAGYQILTGLMSFLATVKLAVAGRLGSSAWEIYSGVLYCLNQQGSMISVVLLMVKMLCETNAVEHGAPPGLNRVLQGRWKLPPFCTYDKATLFWLLTGGLSVAWLPALVTHTAPMFICLIVGFLFPIWSLPFAVLHLLCSQHWKVNFTGPVLSFGATFHAQVWGISATFFVMITFGVYVRKWLWELQTRVSLYAKGGDVAAELTLKKGDRVSAKYTDGVFYQALISDTCEGQRYEVTFIELAGAHPLILQNVDVRKISGPEPHGPYGFNLACCTIMLSLPLLFFTGSLLSAAIMVYSAGSPLTKALMDEFNTRQLVAFNTCMVSKLVSPLDHIVQWLGLI